VKKTTVPNYISIGWNLVKPLNQGARVLPTNQPTINASIILQLMHFIFIFYLLKFINQTETYTQ